MAVLSERSSNGTRASVAELCVVLCADSSAMRRRIVYALTEHDLQVSLTEVDDPQQLCEVEGIDADSIVVFACLPFSSVVYTDSASGTGRAPLLSAGRAAMTSPGS